MTAKSGARRRRDPAEVSRIMSRVRGRDTTPETLFRRALWARGARFRLGAAGLPGRPDLVIASRRLALFIDGDFWHGAQWLRRGAASLEAQFEGTPSRQYWVQKIRRNVSRDFKVTNELVNAGWTVLRLWESELHRNLEACVDLAWRSLQGETQADPRARALLSREIEIYSGAPLLPPAPFSPSRPSSPSSPSSPSCPSCPSTRPTAPLARIVVGKPPSASGLTAPPFLIFARKATRGADAAMKREAIAMNYPTLAIIAQGQWHALVAAAPWVGEFEIPIPPPSPNASSSERDPTPDLDALIARALQGLIEPALALAIRGRPLAARLD